MNTEHTPEPWHAPGLAEIHDSENRVIALLSDTDPVSEEYRPSLSVEEGNANARRIVACVNACAGISTKNLESEGSAVMGWNRTARKLIDVAKQRDELLAAIDYAIKQVPELGTVPGIAAAIASVNEK